MPLPFPASGQARRREIHSDGRRVTDHRPSPLIRFTDEALPEKRSETAQTEAPPTSAGPTGHHGAPPVEEAEPSKVSSPRPPGGKLGVIFSRIAAAPGATIEEPTEETGWQAHTVRAAISRLCRTGQTIILVAGSDGAKTYRLAGGEG